jgi:hypothetical protein
MANPFEIPDEVLRAMANLNMTKEPNWEVIKKFLSVQYIQHANCAALGVLLTNDQVRNYQGASAFLYNLTTYIENPEEELALREAKKPKEEEPQIKMPS